MKSVKVIFKDPKHNYYTSVNGSNTDEEIKKYFVGTDFNVGVYPHENIQKCIKVEIKQPKKET